MLKLRFFLTWEFSNLASGRLAAMLPVYQKLGLKNPCLLTCILTLIFLSNTDLWAGHFVWPVYYWKHPLPSILHETAVESIQGIDTDWCLKNLRFFLLNSPKRRCKCRNIVITSIFHSVFVVSVSLYSSSFLAPLVIISVTQFCHICFISDTFLVSQSLAGQ